ncbi:hypothetical protein EPUS_02218 [Endocarpon pusillum Z07020]|uniref:Uncharacterized protein n=1 Tax=Endocarpon pusillum (strain Z07020 / HMAS-L-300199) TaxID=1263415 RepID=U1I3Q9_ENDPU|nr:uncharacterized protein EPUS_02218 [Endocarpon pusillum Z07020]ERF76679.1 hypothetical protein EPUS_02218 [Endocarpon pusillum Z07020]
MRQVKKLEEVARPTEQDLLESKVDSQMAAERLAPLILFYSEIDLPWHNLSGCLFSAVEKFSDEADLTKLADVLNVSGDS